MDTLRYGQDTHLNKFHKGKLSIHHYALQSQLGLWQRATVAISYFSAEKCPLVVRITHFIQAVFKTFLNIIIHHYRDHVIRENKVIKLE